MVTQRTRLTMAIAVVMCSFPAWTGSVVHAQVGPVTDTFELKVISKEICEDNPRFFELAKTTVKDGVTLTFTQDVHGQGDFTEIQAKINNTGSADVDATTLAGLALRRINALSVPVGSAEFAMSGVNPGNNDHFITLRGKAVFDKLGGLTKVVGTVVYRGMGTYTVDKSGTQSVAVGCFGSGTFVTGKKLP